LYFLVSDIAKYHKDNKNRKLNAGGADERELEEALQRSLKEMGGADDASAGAPPLVGQTLNGKEESKF